MKFSIVLHALCLCVIYVGALAAQPVVPQYKPYDICLEGVATDNPYMAYRLWADFIGPNGETFQAEGFWNGGTDWVIRVAFSHVGEWHYTTRSNDPLLDQNSGSIECILSDSRGFVHQRGRHFYYDDGTPFFRLGDTCWRLYRSKNVPFETHFKPYIDARTEQGFNYIVGVIHTLGEPSINEGGSLWEDDDNLDRLRPEFFNWVDKRIQYMNDRGIVPGIMLVWADTFDDFYQEPYDSDTFSRFRRYIVARYSAFNVFWIVAGEYTETKTPEDYHYHGETIRFGNDTESHGLYDIGDPYNHPISIHPEGQQSNSQDFNLFSPWLGFVMQQHYSSPRLLHEQVMKDYSLGLPVCNDEFGYEGPTDETDPHYYKSNQLARDARKDAWTLVCSGAYVTFGNIYTYTGQEYILDLNHLQSPGAHFMGVLSNFMQSGIHYTTMQPDDDLALSKGVYCLANRDNEYLFYFEHDGTYEFQLDANNLIFDARWIDPVTGETFEDAIFFGDRIYNKTTPFPDDAALYLYNPRNAALNIELLSFHAEKIGKVVHLQWQTAQEINHAGFILERAARDIDFQSVASFATFPELRAGSQQGRSYSFTDRSIAADESYQYRLIDVDMDGRRTIHPSIHVSATSVDVQLSTLPTEAAVYQNYPNPFNGSTSFPIYLPTSQQIRCTIYNTMGQSVWSQAEIRPAGDNIIQWHGQSSVGAAIGSGLYVFELQTEQTVIRRKLLLLE